MSHLLLEEKVMAELVVLEKHLATSSISSENKERSQELISELKKRIEQGVEGAGFGYSFRGFYDYFCREIGFGKIVLTGEGLEAWHNIVDLANSTETLSRTTGPLNHLLF